MEIGSLVASTTTTLNRDYTPAFVLIGGINEDVVLDALTVTVDGDVTININGQANVQAFAKYLQSSLLGADVKIGMLLKVASGDIPSKLQLRLSNAGVTTPTVYGFSASKSKAVPVRAAQQTIQANDSVTYGGGFQALIIDETNLDYAQINFKDGHQDKLTVEELKAYFNLLNPSDADGLLAGQLVVDNKGRNIAKISLYTTSGGTMTVTVVKRLA